MDASVLEAETRPGHKVLDGVRDKHFVWCGRGRDSSADRYGDSGNFAVRQLALAGVDAGADLDPNDEGYDIAIDDVLEPEAFERCWQPLLESRAGHRAAPLTLAWASVRE